MDNINFSFNAPAEIFAKRVRRASNSALKFYRFPSAAEAVQFAIETLPPDTLFGTIMEVDEDRFNGPEIRKLYDSAEYPLRRPPYRKS